VMTKVRFDAIDPRVLPEMSAKVSFLSREVTTEQQRPLVAVNPDALATRDGRSAVFVVRGERVVEAPVTPGVKVGELQAIVGAVKTGEKVVLKPSPDLKSDSLVKIAAK
jgi:HlyD family secretion protein